VQPLLHGEMVAEANAMRADGDLQLMAHWDEDLRDPRGDLRKVVLLELEARLLRLANSLIPQVRVGRSRRRTASTPSELTKVEQMACLIAQRYTQALTVDEISRCVGLHRNYAMGLFKRHIGTTIVDYITQHRVSHAQRLLATTDAKILDVALSSGFASSSRFNAVFRQECGCPPREYRRQHRLAD